MNEVLYIKQGQEPSLQRGGDISTKEHWANMPLFHNNRSETMMKCRISKIEILSSSNAKNDWACDFLKHQNNGTDKARQEAYQGASK